MMEGKCKKKGKSKSSHSRHIHVDDATEGKKSSMKTAIDVISRLLWDDSLPQEKFTVGYLDRFDGIMEKSFSSLDWRDPAIVDNHTLALPKHRIQYFKYRSRKVWDKRTRKDIVFGSTGYSIGIYEFMAMVDNEILNFRDEGVSWKDRPDSDSAENDDISEVDEYEQYENPARSNFFIAARIMNENIVEKLKTVSDYMKQKDELISDCCMKPELFHLTLAILRLESVSDISNACEALKSFISKELPKVSIHLEGLDNFKHRVLYSRVTENENLLKLRNILVEELVSRNVQITDRFSFVPHVTVAKLSRSTCRQRHSKYIDQYLYLQFEDNEFGTQEVTNLSLCEMGAAAREEDGFYKCACEVTLSS